MLGGLQAQLKKEASCQEINNATNCNGTVEEVCIIAYSYKFFRVIMFAILAADMLWQIFLSAKMLSRARGYPKTIINFSEFIFS